RPVRGGRGGRKFHHLTESELPMVARCTPDSCCGVCQRGWALREEGSQRHQGPETVVVRNGRRPQTLLLHGRTTMWCSSHMVENRLSREARYPAPSTAGMPDLWSQFQGRADGGLAVASQGCTGGDGRSARALRRFLSAGCSVQTDRSSGRP